MIDIAEVGAIAQAVIDNADAFRWLVAAVGIWTVIRIVNDPENTLEWLELIATRGIDGKNHPDWDQIGKGAAVVTGVYAMIALLPYAKGDLKGYAVIMFTFFTYAGAVKGWQAYLRSKRGQEQTVTVTRPVPDPGPVETTVTKTVPAPSKESPLQVEIAAGPGKDEPLPVTSTPQKPLQRNDDDR